jgi:hypothetical protein
MIWGWRDVGTFTTIFITECLSLKSGLDTCREWSGWPVLGHRSTWTHPCDQWGGKLELSSLDEIPLLANGCSVRKWQVLSMEGRGGDCFSKERNTHLCSVHPPEDLGLWKWSKLRWALEFKCDTEDEPPASASHWVGCSGSVPTSVQWGSLCRSHGHLVRNKGKMVETKQGSHWISPEWRVLTGPVKSPDSRGPLSL